MALALEQASLASQTGEVPVGAVVVKDGVAIGLGRNSCIEHSDPSAHAEMNALRQAARHESNYRLEDCTLYVTLEPCAMCAGAILNARFSRVVFGAREPKTGAAGSVFNLFDLASLNHQTQVDGGVLAEESATLMQHFFQQQRQSARNNRSPLREDALRTPDSRFQQLAAYPRNPKYSQDLPALAGLRMHYLDEGPADANTVFLCLHGNASWSYVFRKLVPIWVQAQCRVLAPDLIGFGRSDKPKRADAHSLDFHVCYLQEWVDSLNLHNVVLVLQDGNHPVGRMLAMSNEKRYRGPIVLDGGRPISAEERMAYIAPFPDAGHCAGFGRFTDSSEQGHRYTDPFSAWFPDLDEEIAHRVLDGLAPG